VPVRVVGAVLVVVVVAGCSIGGSGGGRAAAIVTTTPYVVSTHCGVNQIKVGADIYVAKEPVPGGTISAPSGWDEPMQRGVLTVYANGTAVFTDDHGHHVTFVKRAHAKILGCA